MAAATFLAPGMRQQPYRQTPIHMSSILNTRLRLVTVAIGLGLSVGCGRLHRGDAGGDLAALARLYFTNESLDEAALYAVSGSQQVRLGTVMAGRTDTLVVPSSVLGAGTLRLVARPLARSIRPQSGLISLQFGDELVVRLPSDEKMLIVLPPPPPAVNHD